MPLEFVGGGVLLIMGKIVACSLWRQIESIASLAIYAAIYRVRNLSYGTQNQEFYAILNRSTSMLINIRRWKRFRSVFDQTLVVYCKRTTFDQQKLVHYKLERLRENNSRSQYHNQSGVTYSYGYIAVDLLATIGYIKHLRKTSIQISNINNE